MDLATLAEQFRAARPAPPNPYSWPSIPNNAYTPENFMPRDTASTPGSRAPLAVRRVTAMGLVTTYRYRFVLGFRISFQRGRPPEMSLFASINPVSPGKPATDANSGRRNFDPYPDYAFKVQIEGIMANKLAAHFQKFDGFDVEVEAIEYKTSTDPHVRKRPGVPKYSTIKLSKGIIDNRELWNWCMKTAQGELTRRNITITVLNEDRDEKTTLVAYDFIGCWPTKWSGLRLDGKGQGTLVEDIEFAVDEIKLAK